MLSTSALCFAKGSSLQNITTPNRLPAAVHNLRCSSASRRASQRCIHRRPHLRHLPPCRRPSFPPTSHTPKLQTRRSSSPCQHLVHERSRSCIFPRTALARRCWSMACLGQIPRRPRRTTLLSAASLPKTRRDGARSGVLYCPARRPAQPRALPIGSQPSN